MGKKSRNGGPSTPVARRTPIQTEPGKPLPTTAPELRLAGNGAFGAARFAEAAHMYTLAIDLLSRGMPRDADGVARAADLFARNRESGGELCTLLLNRSCVHLKLEDAPAAAADAAAAIEADPSREKAHLRQMR